MNFLKKMLPWIGAAASAVATGGPVGLLAVAAKGIGEIVGKQVNANPDAIAAAVAGATPDQLLAMKKLDQDFALQMQQAGFQNEQELEQVAAGDRANARQREMTIRDKVPAYLAAFVTVGFFSVLGLMFFHQIPNAGHDALMLMLGSLGTAWTGVIAYYFGSSAGSAQKTDLLAKAPAILDK